MKNINRLALLAGMLWATGAYAQHDCGVGAITGSRSASADPEETQLCVLMGRMFCHVAQFRNTSTPAERAVNETMGWFQRMSQTGSHLTRINYRPLAEDVAHYLYAHPQQPSWTSYYYAVYTCGLDQRTPAGPAKAAALQRWEPLAQDCEKKLPGVNEGYVNDPLRTCLREGMKTAAAAAK